MAEMAGNGGAAQDMALAEVLAPFAAARSGYEARRRRTEWPASVRADAEVLALDEQSGRWVLCRTCAAHYERTRRGRGPNAPEGFKVKMNGRFQEAAWVMHKARVAAHRTVSRAPVQASESEEDEQAEDNVMRLESDEDEDTEPLPGSGKRRKTLGNDQDNGLQLMHLPRTGWRCPGIVPDAFYNAQAKLVHAFAKYYVGSYRINVVRDLRSDKVLLFSHDCENRVVKRERSSQPLSCDKCYAIWLHNKSFKRALRKMERYVLVEDILSHSWSISPEELAVLSRFKHSSDMNLNVEGRKLKQAAMAACRHYGATAKSCLPRNDSDSGTNSRSEVVDRVEHPLPLDMMLHLQSLESDLHDDASIASAPERLHTEQQPSSPNSYLTHPSGKTPSHLNPRT